MTDAEFSRTGFPVFKFNLSQDRPVLDLSPHHARMACCYRDKAGMYHLFVDFIDTSLNTVHSFQAIVKYYTSSDLLNWKFIEIPVDRGSYDYISKTGEPDCYGISSPDVLCTDAYIYLFYAGRGNLVPEEKFNGLAHPGEPGYISCDILFAKAPADINGAPCGAFVKQGFAAKREYHWESMRLDDPCVLTDGCKIHLYFKGFNDNTNHNNIKLGYAAADLPDMKFTKDTEPVLSVEGGLEMPGVFKYSGKWNMFLRHFEKGAGTVWKHHVSENGIDWVLFNDNLFDCAGKNPGTGATDMALIKNFDGSFSKKALACGLEDGILKLWLYNVGLLSN